MGKVKGLWLAMSLALLFASACSNKAASSKEQVQTIIDNMVENSFDFTSALHAEADSKKMERLFALDGSYVAGRGYIAEAKVRLSGFKSESNILAADDQLYYKLANDRRWKPTTAQDLQMFGISYKESPATMLQEMKESVVNIEQKSKNSFRITLDRNKYAQQAGAKTLQLPQVDNSNNVSIELLGNPSVDVEIDVQRQLVRTLTLHYKAKMTGVDGEDETVNMTYEVTMRNFNNGQTLPKL
ncbi:hypothetical protein [Numidum massiliense]|uniref:hypothetical protein n=1 Tax=Numidum massiliense TaxID=1522315 RepID=UPI0006D52EDA|nr:hypothetical protein [Numidum massiliense]